MSKTQAAKLVKSTKRELSLQRTLNTVPGVFSEAYKAAIVRHSEALKLAVAAGVAFSHP